MESCQLIKRLRDKKKKKKKKKNKKKKKKTSYADKQQYYDGICKIKFKKVSRWENNETICPKTGIMLSSYVCISDFYWQCIK